MSPIGFHWRADERHGAGCNTSLDDRSQRGVGQGHWLGVELVPRERQFGKDHEPRLRRTDRFSVGLGVQDNIVRLTTRLRSSDRQRTRHGQIVTQRARSLPVFHQGCGHASAGANQIVASGGSVTGAENGWP